MQKRVAYLNVEFPLAAGVIHVPNLAKYFPLLPPHVVDTHHGPCTSRETVGISPIQLVLVIEEDAPVAW